MASENDNLIQKLHFVENLLKSLKKEESLSEKDWETFSIAEKYFGEKYQFKNYSQFLKKLPLSAIHEYINELQKEEVEKETKPKEQEASIPPELESLVAEYQQNQALLESEEIKSNSQRSVAQQVKIAIAHSKIKNLALANKQRRQDKGEKFQDKDDVFVSLGSPKSESLNDALSTSYKAVQEVALTYKGFSKLSKTLQDEIIANAVELHTIGLTDLDTAIQSSTLEIDSSKLSDSDKTNLATIPGGFVSTVYQEIKSQDKKTSEYQNTLNENEQKLIQLEDRLLTKSEAEKAAVSVEIKSLIADNEKISLALEEQEKVFLDTVSKQTEAFKAFSTDREKRLSQNPDTRDRIEAANKNIASIQNTLELNGIKPNLFNPLSEAYLLEQAIRQDMPGVLDAHAGYEAEYAAALVNNPKTKDSDLSPEAILLSGKNLDPKLLAKARLFAKENPDSALGKLFKTREDIFNAASSQIRKIAASPLGKEITKVSTGLGKVIKPVSRFFGKISDKIPGGFGNLLRIAQDPVGAFRSWAGKKVGTYVVKKILASTAGKAAVAAGKKLAGELLKKGVGKAVAAIAAKLGIKVFLAGTVVGAPVALVLLAIDIISAVFKIIKNVVQKIATSIYGEEIKAQDLLAVPVAGVAAAGSAVAGFFTTIVVSTVAASSSSIIIIIISTIIFCFVYITSFVTAPLISTLVQLESTTSSSQKDCNSTTLTNDKKVCNGDYCFPVNDTTLVSYATYHHDYPANDILRIGDQPGPEDDIPIPLLAYTSGTVTWTSEGDNLGGLALIIAGNDGRFYYYAHNMCNLVSTGQTVSAGEVVAGMDSSGNTSSYLEHLHFQISDQADMTTIPENYPHFITPWEDFCTKLNMCGNLNPNQNPELPYL